jgi:hypothetical protein
VERGIARTMDMLGHWIHWVAGGPRVNLSSYEGACNEKNSSSSYSPMLGRSDESCGMAA